MSLVVQKYGGTSVGTIEKMKNVVERIITKKEQGNDVVVVVSAMGKTTDVLMKMAKEITDNPCKREMDVLLSTGEQVSIALISMILKERGYDSLSFTGLQAGIMTEGQHMKNRIADINTKSIDEALKEGKVVVVAGFQGVNGQGEITTLGRGGSDTTAVALAAKLKGTCEIYTDVEGIYTVDPREYSEAKKLEYISYGEMLEMSSLGAGVMETRAVEIAYKFNVPIYVASSLNNEVGTWIKEMDANMEEKAITGLTINEDIIMVTVNNVKYCTDNIALIFGKLGEHNINVDMISQSAPNNGQVNISFTISKEDVYAINEVINELYEELKSVNIDLVHDIIKVSVVGIGMMNASGVAARVFKTFAREQIEFKQVTTSEISISYTIAKENKEKAVISLSKEFEL